jgi:hypothetical protein
MFQCQIFLLASYEFVGARLNMSVLAFNGLYNFFCCANRGRKDFGSLKSQG